MTDSPNTSSPFRKPGFIVAAVVIGLLAILGIALGIRALVVPADPDAGQSTPTTAPTTSEPSTPEPTAEPADDEPSVCGLDAVAMEGGVTSVPETTWEYAGAGSVALPTSANFGPGVTDSFASCFARTPEGAIFAGAVSVVQAASLTGSARTEWAEYLIGDGPQRDQLLADSSSQSDAQTSGIEMSISGFRLLEYDGDTALVNIAATGRGDGEEVVLSTTYALVWQDGDWKIDATQTSPAASVLVPDLGGFTRWSE